MTNQEMRQILLNKMKTVAGGIDCMSTCKSDIAYALALEKLASAYASLKEAEDNG